MHVFLLFPVDIYLYWSIFDTPRRLNIFEDTTEGGIR